MKPSSFPPCCICYQKKKNTRAVPMHAYTMMGRKYMQILFRYSLPHRLKYIYHTFIHFTTGRERGGGDPDTTYKFILRFSSPPQHTLFPIPNFTAKKFRFMCSQKRNCAASLSISTFMCLLATYSIYSTYGPPIFLQQKRQTDHKVFYSFSTGNRSFIFNRYSRYRILSEPKFLFMFIFIFPLQMSSLSLSQSLHQHEVFTPGTVQYSKSNTEVCTVLHRVADPLALSRNPDPGVAFLKKFRNHL
jgi:hypothetical protein